MMRVLDVILKGNQNRVTTYHVRGKGETSVETVLDKILSNANMNLAYQRVYQNREIGGEAKWTYLPYLPLKAIFVKMEKK